MYDIAAQADDAISFWEKQPTDQPYLVNGFNGTWNFSDHSLIPETLHNFILESFHPAEKFKRIPLEDINKLMNEVWEGPGSMVKIMKLLKVMRIQRQNGNTAKIKLDDVKTIDDYTESDFQFSPASEAELASDDED